MVNQDYKAVIKCVDCSNEWIIELSGDDSIIIGSKYLKLILPEYALKIGAPLVKDEHCPKCFSPNLTLKDKILSD